MKIRKLKNIGNTCYINSCLQLFFDIESLCDLIGAGSDPAICEVIHNNCSTINPAALKNETAKMNPRFRGMNQQDSFEFLIYLFDFVSRTIPVSDHVSFSIEQSTKCLCGHVGSKTFSDLFMILPMDNRCTHIDDCVSLYLDSSNSCPASCPTPETISSITSKRYLIVVLKRYSNSIQKNNAKIQVPEELVVCSRTYSLRGFIHHYGFITCGHYVYIRKIKNKWFIFNDENIEEITHNQKLIDYKDSGYVYLFELN